ncbi:MAG: type III-B CRISPR module RAMP protein Cmr1 [Ktedonobacteraceae bacterium]|nr:type III-B CRISPR module RAMP protein Cmr1 [Ktedonobacteraceae bacterium]
MQKGIFEVQTLTPLFLSGADLHTAELRPPALRGMLRYWYRALIGGMVGTDEQGLTIVQQAESALFGATEKGSAVTAQIAHASALPRIFNERISIRQEEQWRSTGIGYLLWSMAQSGKEERGNFKPARWYFPPGTGFQVTLAVHAGNERLLQQAISALWLLTRLGGLGSRSRRCAGSLVAHPLTDIFSDLPFAPPEQVPELKRQLEDGIAIARTLNEQKTRPLQDADFDVLAPEVCRIWVLQDKQPWPNAEVAMQSIGKKLQDYRNSLNIVQRKIFGLPLPPLSYQRRSSPLLLRIAQLRNNTCVGIALLFKTIGNNVRKEDYAILEQWIQTFPGAVEVML